MDVVNFLLHGHGEAQLWQDVIGSQTFCGALDSTSTGTAARMCHFESLQAQTSNLSLRSEPEALGDDSAALWRPFPDVWEFDLMLRLIHRPTSSCSFRVRIGLNLKDIPYESLVRQADDPEISAQNPQGKVPYLIAGKTHLSQSLAILEWIEESYPAGPALLPKVCWLDQQATTLTKTTQSSVFAKQTHFFWLRILLDVPVCAPLHNLYVVIFSLCRILYSLSIRQLGLTAKTLASFGHGVHFQNWRLICLQERQVHFVMAIFLPWLTRA